MHACMYGGGRRYIKIQNIFITHQPSWASSDVMSSGVLARIQPKSTKNNIKSS